MQGRMGKAVWGFEHALKSKGQEARYFYLDSGCGMVLGRLPEM